MALINPDNIGSRESISYVQPLPSQPSVNDGNQVANGKDTEMSVSPDQWLASYLSSMDKGKVFTLMNDPSGSAWSSIMAAGLKEGALSVGDVQSLTSQFGRTYTPEFEKYLNNLQSQENATTEYNRELEARDTSITSTLNQLRQNQMSTGLLSSLGGASSGVSLSPAQADHSNIGQARKMAEFNRKTAMAKTMIGLLGGMASAGIYGGSMMAGRKAVASLAADASRDVAMIKRKTGRTHINTNGTISRDIFDYSW